MKAYSHLVAAALVTIGVGFSAQAGEPLMSPRAKELVHSQKQVPAAVSHVNLATQRPVGNAREWELIRSFRQVASTGMSVDLANAQRPIFAPKDPRFEAAWHASAVRGFHAGGALKSSK